MQETYYFCSVERQELSNLKLFVMKTKFYRCRVCGNIVTKLHDSGVGPYCCSQPMEELRANTEDASHEKHVPVLTKTDDSHLMVRVGADPHPMTDEHHIMFIYLETRDKKGNHEGHFVLLDKTGEPMKEFCACSGEVVALYAYCNLHGLWCQNFEEPKKR